MTRVVRSEFCKATGHHCPRQVALNPFRRLPTPRVVQLGFPGLISRSTSCSGSFNNNMPRESTRVVSWTEKTDKKVLVEGAVTVEAPRQHTFAAVSDVLLMPKLYPATKSVKVLSQEQDPAGSVTTTVLEQEQTIEFLKYFGGSFSTTVRCVADASSFTVASKVVRSTLMESGEVSITVRWDSEPDTGRAAGAAGDTSPEGPRDQQGAGAGSSVVAGTEGEVAAQAAAVKVGSLRVGRSRVEYRALMKMRVLPPLQSWREQVYQMQCDEVAGMLANLQGLLAQGPPAGVLALA